MKKLIALAGTILMAGALALPATPANAQSFSFGFGIGDGGYRHHSRWDWWPPRHHHHHHHRHYHRGPSISFDIGPVDVRVRSSHVARCEARFRSYDRYSDTYLGYDGDRHRCRL